MRMTRLHAVHHVGHRCSRRSCASQHFPTSLVLPAAILPLGGDTLLCCHSTFQFCRPSQA